MGDLHCGWGESRSLLTCVHPTELMLEFEHPELDDCDELIVEEEDDDDDDKDESLSLLNFFDGVG